MICALNTLCIAIQFAVAKEVRVGALSFGFGASYGCAGQQIGSLPCRLRHVYRSRGGHRLDAMFT